MNTVYYTVDWKNQYTVIPAKDYNDLSAFLDTNEMGLLWQEMLLFNPRKPNIISNALFLINNSLSFKRRTFRVGVNRSYLTLKLTLFEIDKNNFILIVNDMNKSLYYYVKWDNHCLLCSLFFCDDWCELDHEIDEAFLFFDLDEIMENREENFDEIQDVMNWFSSLDFLPSYCKSFDELVKLMMGINISPMKCDKIEYF